MTADVEAPPCFVLERESGWEVTMKIDSTIFGAITIDGRTYEHDVVVRLSGEVLKRKKEAVKNSCMVPRMCFQKTRQNFSSRMGAIRSPLARVRWATCTCHRKLKPISKEGAATSC